MSPIIISITAPLDCYLGNTSTSVSVQWDIRYSSPYLGWGLVLLCDRFKHLNELLFRYPTTKGTTLCIHYQHVFNLSRSVWLNNCNVCHYFKIYRLASRQSDPNKQCWHYTTYISHELKVLESLWESVLAGLQLHAGVPPELCLVVRLNPVHLEAGPPVSP